MQSKTTTRPACSTMFARCRSPWHSRTKPSRQPLLEQRRQPRMRIARPRLQRGDARGDVGSVFQRQHMLEVGQRVGQRDLGRAPRTRGAGDRRDRMEARDHARQFVDVFRRQRARRQHPVEFLRAVEAPHAHRILERRAGTADPRFIGGSGDRHDVEIEIGREPAIEPHFVLARGAPLGERREVEEPEVEVFFQLVGEVAGEHHPRNVRLDALDVRRRMRKAPGLAQAVDQRSERVQGQTVCFVAWSGNR